jgi:hypothetical protein
VLNQNTFNELHTFTNPDTVQDAVLAQVNGVQGLLQPGHSNPSNSMESILRVLTKDMEFGAQSGGHLQHGLPPTTLRSYVLFVTLLQRFRPLSAFSAVGLRQEFLTFYIMILCRNVERRAFITSEGHLGIGSAILQEWDTVAIICGTEVPLLLRSCDSGVYELIGEAYVDGIMDGEAMEIIQTFQCSRFADYHGGFQ